MPSCENPCPDGLAHYCPHFHVTLPAPQLEGHGSVYQFFRWKNEDILFTSAAGSNPGGVKAGLLNSRIPHYQQCLASCICAFFFCAHYSVCGSWSALSAGAPRATQEHLGHHPLCTAPGTHSSHSRNQTDSVESGFLSSAPGFHLLTSVCTGFMWLLT